MRAVSSLPTLICAASLFCNCKGDCQASPELGAEFQAAAKLAAAVQDPFAAFDRIAPFRAVRDEHPDNIFAHERYQDAVNEYGIEGHLRLVSKEYQALDFNHPGDPLYRYLYLRTLAGRRTPGAIQGLVELLSAHPDFVAAHRALAEIYSTGAFRDDTKAKAEKDHYLAVCPGAKFAQWPPAIPELSLLIQQAGSALAGGDPRLAIELTIQGLKEFEWRSQRIRAFDWYALDYKVQDARDLRIHYWEAWEVQVGAYRLMHQDERAEQLFRAMAQRAARLAKTPGLEYRFAVETLARLNGETQPKRN
jgi:hypothetical protein